MRRNISDSLIYSVSLLEDRLWESLSEFELALSKKMAPVSESF